MEQEEEYNKLFVGGDISGIQKFLYNITSRYASVSLKGRSAYLSTYLSDVCDRVEQSIKDNGVNPDRLYCSGGKFYLITDNTPSIVSAIEKCAAEEEANLWKEHQGQLGLNISYVAFKECDGKYYVEGHEDEETSSGVLWKYCNANFARQKNQKFKTHILNNYKEFFEVIKVGGKPKVCALTGIESDDCKPLPNAKAEDEGLVFHPSVIEQIKEGQRLNSQEGVNKDFEDYATTDGGTKGDTYLGVLRMDVDGMGKRFIIGFPDIEEYRNFSQKATDFFEKYIKESLINEPVNDAKSHKDTYKQYLNIIYAGGDDLFIVGRWDKVIDFAELIHKKTVETFKNDSYTDIFDPEKKECHISISGGVAIVKPKFPIAKAADLAGEAEDASKSYRKEKNCFNMFGKTVTWDEEFEYVKDFKNKFVEYISKYKNDYGFSKSILHKIMLYSEIADMNVEHKSRDKNVNYSYMWHMAYYLTRFMDKYKNHADDKIKKRLYEFCLNLRDKELPAKEGRNLTLIAIAARWAELTLRDA